MKELSIEEKAKRYDGLIERLKDLKFAYRFSPLSDTIEDLFPELKESEDERIRKALKEYFINSFQNNGVAAICGVHIKDILAWLEKQGEQKFGWSEYDEIALNRIIPTLESIKVKAPAYLLQDIIWLKSLKDRIQPQPQPKQEWSEEDCNQIETIACHLDNIGNEAMAESLLNIMDKYKSCRPYNTWKPSIEQMKALRAARATFGVDGVVLASLIYDLEKLTE